MIKTAIKVEIALGLHARPSAKLVTSLKGLKAEVKATCGERKANFNSIMEAMLLSVPCGETITVEADGPDEEKAIEVIKEILAMRDL